MHSVQSSPETADLQEIGLRFRATPKVLIEHGVDRNGGKSPNPSTKYISDIILRKLSIY